MNVAALYDEIRETINGANTSAMEASFLNALKKVISDLNIRLRESIVAPDFVSEAEVGFPEYCDNVFHPGVKFYMQRAGQWAQDPDNESYQFYRQMLNEVIGYAIDADEAFKTRNEE